MTEALVATLYGQQQRVLALWVPFVASAEAQAKALLGYEALSTESCWRILTGDLARVIVYLSPC